jgi:hypothetical protein
MHTTTTSSLLLQLAQSLQHLRQRLPGYFDVTTRRVLINLQSNGLKFRGRLTQSSILSDLVL